MKTPWSAGVATILQVYRARILYSLWNLVVQDKTPKRQNIPQRDIKGSTTYFYWWHDLYLFTD